MKFDKSRILTCVTADQANVGDWGWFANDYEGLLEAIAVGRDKLMVLDSVHGRDTCYRFDCSGVAFALFYPAPYDIQQSKWVEINNLKVGDKVKIIKEWTKGEKGFGFSKDHFMLVGYTFEVAEIWKTFIKVKVEITSNEYTYVEVPYFAIEKVEGPTYPELQAVWVKENNLKVGDRVRVISKWSMGEKGFSIEPSSIPEGIVGKVDRIFSDEISLVAVNNNAEFITLYVPYFVIEKINKERR